MREADPRVGGSSPGTAGGPPGRSPGRSAGQSGPPPADAPPGPWGRRTVRGGVAGQGWLGAVVAVALAVAVYLLNLLYTQLNHGPYRIFLRTPLDKAMPLVPPMVIPYVSLDYLVYATLIVLLLVNLRLFHSAAAAMVVAFLLSFLCYWVAQSYVVRPALVGTDLFTRMLREVYSGDQPYNDFPSLHTSASTIMALHWWRFDRRVGAVVAVWCALIVASTVLVHQHYLADVAGGLAVALAATWVGRRLADLVAARSGGPVPA